MFLFRLSRALSHSTRYVSPLTRHDARNRLVCNRPVRPFHFSRPRFDAEAGTKKPYAERLKEAWNKTEVKWYPIPVGLGVAFLGFQQFRHIRERERRKVESQLDAQASAQGRTPVVIAGPWQVRIIAISCWQKRVSYSPFFFSLLFPQ